MFSITEFVSISWFGLANKVRRFDQEICSDISNGRHTIVGLRTEAELSLNTKTRT